MVTTVLFDLDGTLLPMDMDIFLEAYFTGLSAKMARHGYEPTRLMKTIWKATAAMVGNNGSVSNEEALWSEFEKEYGPDAKKDAHLFEEYYEQEFLQVRSKCGFNELAAKCVRQIKAMGYRVILATNPLFPAVATNTRIRWAGLEPEEFELVTTYESCHYCKPNPEYYREILGRLQLTSSQCIMVGNDATEDLAAQQLGIPVFLLTDHLINKQAIDVETLPHGGFGELMEYIRSLS